MKVLNIFIAIFILVILVLIGVGVFSIRLDFAGGSHRIIPTAIDTDIWGNYKVYYKTSEYTKNSEEEFYYIDKTNKELAQEMQEHIKEKHEITVYYEKYVGFKGITAPGSAPIIKIEY